MAEIKHKIFQRTRKNLFLHTISVETYGLDDIHQAINEVLDLITKVNNDEKFYAKKSFENHCLFVINRLLDNDNMKIYYQKPVVLYEDYESFHEYNIPKVLTDIILAYKEDYHPLHKHYAKDFIYALHHNIYDIYRRLYQNRIKPSKS